MTLLSPKVFHVRHYVEFYSFAHIKSENIITTIFWVVVS